MNDLLSRNHDGSPNFDVSLITSDKSEVTRPSLRLAAEELFTKADVDVAVFYFAGHGMHSHASGGFLVTQDFTTGDEGISMGALIAMANGSPARECVIILDCCHAGAADEFLGYKNTVPMREGVTFLAACRPTETSAEVNNRGVFTAHVCDALGGGASDVRGYVSAPGIYAYVNEVLGGWEQRPLMRASMSRVTPLRRAEDSISDEKLRCLVDWFPTAEYEFPLDPSYEPDSGEPDPENVKIFDVLQQMRAARVIEPVGSPHMYFAAMERKSCRMTPLGKFYWQAVRARKI